MKKKLSKKVKIIIVGSFPNKKKNIYGGQLTACRALISSKLKNQFKIITFNTSYFSNPPPKLFIRAMFAVIRIIKYIYSILQNKPKIIIIFVADKFSAIEKGLMILIGKLLNKSVMIFPRAGALINQYSNNIIFKKYIDFTFSKSDVFLSQGNTFQQFAIRELKFSRNNAPIIPNWTANDKYLSIGLSRNYLNNNSINKILFMGWLEDFKGVKELLKAALILKRNNYKFHLFFAGDGSCKNFAEEFIIKNDMNQEVSLLGWANEKAKIELLKKSNIFLLPSWNEGFPNSLIEAMSSGLASVVSSVGNIPDFVENDKNCMLIRPKNVDDIICAIKKLLDDPKYLQKVAQNGYLYAKSNFTADNGLKLLIEEIKKLS